MSRSGYHQTDVMPPKRRKSPASLAATSWFAIFAFAVLGASAFVPSVLGQQDQAKIAAATSEMRQLGDALDEYKLHVGSYPSTTDGLGALVTAPQKTPNWNGPYLKSPIQKDPWGHPYEYECLGKTKYRLLSYGADGAQGGTGYSEDIEESTASAGNDDF